ncbi:MAG TPA: 4Fe-4S binding protein [Rhodocyclaceae bacterium]|nr:4Fe-4S binding protein [Rhodocyclaceae bacterium]
MTVQPNLSLSRLRLGVQVLMLALTVWGGNLVGYYMADKLSQALPALSCAYDQQNGGYCILISLQHQLDHRIGEALAKAHHITWQILLPLFFTVLSFMAFFVVLGKAFCGWVCPLGTLQDWLNRLGRRFHLPLREVGSERLHKVRPVKWLMLLGLVFALPLLTGLGVTPHALGNPYCDVCPSRIATTLLTGSPGELALATGDGWRFALGAIANTLVGFILIAALASRQPFCRICPLLAFNALFQRLSLARLAKRPHDRCEQCGICTKACPMEIVEIAKEHGGKAFHDDCTLCGRCAEFCPDDGVIALKWGPWSLFQSSRAYYRQRVLGELPDGTVKPVKFQKKPEARNAA